MLFACGRTGLIAAPLNTRLTVPELAFIIRNCGAKALLYDSGYGEIARALAHGSCIESAVEFGTGSTSYQRLLKEGVTLDRPADLSHSDTHMIMYTSGTTGRPKGAILTYGMMFWNAINIRESAKISSEARALAVMPMFHTGGVNVYCMPVLQAGGAVYIMRSFDSGKVLSAIGDGGYGITHFFSVPSAWAMLAEHASFERTNLSRLLTAGVGGASVSAALWERYRSRGVYLQNGYGLTETSPAVAMPTFDDEVIKHGSIGRALMHTELKVVRADGSEAGADEPGEFWVRGPNVTPGYWEDEAATASAFAGSWFRTGDVGRKDEDGFLYLLDRAKDMYISGGENVYPSEVEKVLLQIDEVSNAAVIGIEDPRWGETGAAFLTLKPGCSILPSQVLAHCAVHLARFKHPRTVIIVDDLPLTGSGKVHKATLRKQLGPLLNRNLTADG
jgi:fatty-acyl-CoA synthase